MTNGMYIQPVTLSNARMLLAMMTSVNGNSLLEEHHREISFRLEKRAFGNTSELTEEWNKIVVDIMQEQPLELFEDIIQNSPYYLYKFTLNTNRMAAAWFLDNYTPPVPKTTRSENYVATKSVDDVSPNETVEIVNDLAVQPTTPDKSDKSDKSDTDYTFQLYSYDELMNYTLAELKDLADEVAGSSGGGRTKKQIAEFIIQATS